MYERTRNSIHFVMVLFLLLCSGAALAQVQTDRAPAETGDESYTPLWRHLEMMSPAEKENAVIRFETLIDLPREVIEESVEIEKLWEAGDHDGAIERLHDLEPAAGRHLAISTHWKTPIPTSLPGDGPDVQVDVRSEVYNMDLDFHEGTGNLFAVLMRRGSNNPRWTVNISTDNGLSWNETYSWIFTSDVLSTSAVVVSDYLYIAYVAPDGHGYLYNARIRRCSVSNGGVDGIYGYKIVFNKGVNIDQVALTANPDTSNSRIYYFTILNDGTLTYHWDDTAGSSWTEIATGVTDAAYSLDASFNPGYADKFVMASYHSTTGRVKVAMRSLAGWEVDDLDDGAGRTAIAAYEDTLIVVYPDYYVNGLGIKYNVSYNAGLTWAFGDVVVPGVGEYFHGHDVTGRRGGGFNVIYCQDVGGPVNPLWYVRRDYGTPGWTAPEQINEVDVHVGLRMNIEWLPPLPGGGPHEYGSLWIGYYLKQERYAFFQRSDGDIGFFSADVYTIDAGTGGTVNLSLDAGATNGERNYLILGGVTGIEPGFNLPGGFVTLPLNWDAFTDVVLDLTNTVVFQYFLGLLNRSGEGWAAINAPILPPTAIGVNLYFAYCLNAPFDFASNAISIKIVP